MKRKRSWWVGIAFLATIGIVVSYLALGAFQLIRVCSTEGFQVVNFETVPDDGHMTFGYSVAPLGFYCERAGERVVQFFPHMPSREEIAEHGFL